MIQRFKTFPLLIILALIFTSQSSQAQTKNDVKLDDMFYDYEVKSYNSKNLFATARSGGFFTIEIPKKDKGTWELELHDSKIIGDNYISQYVDENGIQNGQPTRAIATKGHVKGDLYTSVSLTFNDGFIYGFIKDKTGYNYIEPLEYYDSKSRGKDLYVVYNEKDIKPTGPKTCGNTELENKQGEIENHIKNNEDSRSVDECFEVEWAIANDWLMFDEYGSVAAVENHAIGVANNVQTNYDDEFADELQLIVVQQFTVTTSNGDPWSNTTSAGALLNSFRSWGPGGFAAVHDIGSLWTDRNFDGSTIGIAYVGVVCTGSRYNCLQDFTNFAETKRVMVAHEIGHNFNASHDAGNSGFIMAPSVNNTTVWSNASINSVNNHVASRFCLSDCANGGAAPNADFSFIVLDDCTVGEVVFTDNSGGSNLNYEWSFPGGVPSTSNQQSPSVQYPDAGVYDATLTVSNGAGSDVQVQNNIFTINPSPQVNFSYATTETVVSFFNLTQNADTYLWDFGNGATSIDSDPVYDYIDDGVYTVTLTASSDCGDITLEEIIVIATVPEADFTASAIEGCAPLTVQFTSQSSNNTDDFIWTFEGGTPSSSTQENPEVTFEEAGEYDVTLTVINETGDDVKQEVDFINVNGLPLADFTSTADGNEVTFNNTSDFGESFIWTFGDGNSSTEENPTHTYQDDGDFTVVLTVENDCGSNSISTTVSISLAPQPSFDVADSAEGCAPLMVNFQNTSSNSPDSYAWTFEGGTPATSTDENPNVSYTQAGSYDVTLTVTNGNGSNSETFTDYIIVGDAPVADFTADQDGLTVTFIDNSSGATSYMWSFGDGNTSDEANPTHTYAEEGNYTVFLETINECGVSTDEMVINNYTAVAAGFTSDITSGCADLEVSFSDQSSSNVTSWSWTFEGGTPATSIEENPTVNYTAAGQYDVILTVSHPESSETITLVNYVAVSDVPVTSFEFFDDVFEVEFTNTTIEGTSYSWDFGDGNSSTMENPTHVYDNEGTYDVILTATNGCGTTSSSMTVTINALPTAGFNSTNAIGCGPLTVDFNNASSTNAESWTWTFEGGTPATSTEENPTVTFDTPGAYDVTLTVTSPAGLDDISMENFVVVLDVPSPVIDATTDGNTVSAINTSDDADDVTWSVNGESFSTESLDYTFPANGTYGISLEATNQCGTSSTSVTIDVDVYPTVSIGALPFTGCVGESITLSDNSTNADSREWMLPNGNPEISTDNTPEVTYATTGLYDITLTVTNEFGSSTETFQDAVVIIDVPVASFEAVQSENTIDFTSTSVGALAYAWDFGDGTTSDEENPSHTYTADGEYTVTLTVSNACGEVEATESYMITISSVSEADFAKMSVYPNPATEYISITVDNQESTLITVALIDVQGRTLKTDTFRSGAHTIDTSTLPSGTYMMRLSSEDATYLKKVVIMK